MTTPEHVHAESIDGPSAAECARRAVLATLDELDIPPTVQTCYGETVDTHGILAWLLSWDAPTLTGLAAIIGAARDAQ